MGHRCHVLNRQDLDTECVECAHRRLAAGAWALDLNIDIFYTAFHSRATGRFSGYLRGDFLDPLKPAPPDVAQASALP